MAADNAVDRIREINRNDNVSYADFKMNGRHIKNGIILANETDISAFLDKNGEQNGCDKLTKKLNGFCTHINAGTLSPVRDGIRASSLRASPVRNKSMSVPNLDSAKAEINGENRLNEDSKKSEGLPCKWMDCDFNACDITELASHAQENHVDPMKAYEVFVCLWQDCKVFNRPSCSMSWLTKHLESHIGVKPFKCIFEGCSMSFSTQTGLARHVPCHFQDNPRQAKRNANNNIGKDDSPSKKQLKRKRLKYIRYKKPGTQGKVEDFVDQHAVESIKKRLASMIVTDDQPIGINGSTIHFIGQPLGNRIDANGKKEILFHWIPESILPDEWIPFDAERTKTLPRQSVPIRCLPNDVKAELHPSFYRKLSHRKKRRK